MLTPNPHSKTAKEQHGRDADPQWHLGSSYGDFDSQNEAENVKERDDADDDQGKQRGWFHGYLRIPEADPVRLTHCRLQDLSRNLLETSRTSQGARHTLRSIRLGQLHDLFVHWLSDNVSAVHDAARAERQLGEAVSAALPCPYLSPAAAASRAARRGAA